jgi:hypothetical protein
MAVIVVHGTSRVHTNTHTHTHIHTRLQTQSTRGRPGNNVLTEILMSFRLCPKSGSLLLGLKDSTSSTKILEHTR